MKALVSILTFIAVLASFVACSKVNLVGNDVSSPEDIRSSTQLTDPKVIKTVIPQIENCQNADSDLFACLLILDSFERDSVEESLSNGGFGWSSLIDDVLGSNGDRVEADIYNDSQLGVTPDAVTGSATDQGRSLVYTGRPGGSVHSIFLVSSPINLSDFNSVFVSFQYLPLGLEVWNWAGKTGNEHIRLEVCEASLEACGVLPNLDEDQLNSANWSVRFQSAPGDGAGLDGHNHQLTNWKTGSVDIDISNMDLAAKSSFVFRITVTLDEGFLNNDINGSLEDGVALDNVIAMASKVTVPLDVIIEDPEPTPNRNDNID